jgi:predicted PhzF superfamily epimerase YddE/YHI9
LGFYDLRWFTPTMEVPLCGHATIASAWVIFFKLAPELDCVRFATQSGVLTVEKGPDGCHRMALPAGRVESWTGPEELSHARGESLGVGPPSEIHFAPTGAGGTPAPLAVWPEAAIRLTQYSGALSAALFDAGLDALLATARGDGAPYDYVAILCAYQASPRGGDLLCTDEGERVVLSGPCVLYLRGEIEF